MLSLFFPVHWSKTLPIGFLNLLISLLLRQLAIGDTEELQALGILELDEEDPDYDTESDMEETDDDFEIIS